MDCIAGAREGAHYSAAVVHRGLVYVSGQLPIVAKTGEVASGGAEGQTRQALANLDGVLAAAGCSRADVLHCRVYTPDIAHWDAINAVYAEYFGPHKPARCVVPTGTALHFGSLVEIEAVAAQKEE